MSLKLYYSPTSPFARKIRIALIELGLDHELEHVTFNPYEAGEEFWAINPLSKVPTLVTREGVALPDSRVILDYVRTLGDALEGEGGSANLWPNRRRQQLADGLLDAAVVANLEQRREPQLVSKNWFDRQTAAVTRALAELERDASTLRTSHAITPLEISVAVALAYLDLRLAPLQWRDKNPRLASWYEVISQRPSLRQTEPAL
jgi:glutathione S-transferase